jgi:hypothetical protein
MTLQLMMIHWPLHQVRDRLTNGQTRLVLHRNVCVRGSLGSRGQSASITLCRRFKAVRYNLLPELTTLDVDPSFSLMAGLDI